MSSSPKREFVSMFVAVAFSGMVFGRMPDDAPLLPMVGTRIVNVATEEQLQAAMGNLRHGDTLLLAEGTYSLTSSLYVNGRNNVTIRGAAGSTNVVLAGKGMDNRNHGGVPFGVWSNGTNTTIAHLTIRDTYDNPIILNPGAQSPRIYNVRLVNAGSQFIKSNPTDVAAGLGVNNGVVEYCWLEYVGPPPADHGAGTGYFNGISAHAARDWIVRHNVFRNLHNPDGTAYPWNPAVLFWRRSAGTVTEQNTFINVDRAVAYGLGNDPPFSDHSGGIIRNNFVYLAPGLLSAARRASSDGSIIVWNSPGTRVDHNTLLLNSNVFYAVEFRFPTTTNAAARHNLADGSIHLRDGANAAMSGNRSTARAEMFVNPVGGDLHLKPAASSAVEQAPPLTTVTNDFDGDARPSSGGTEIGADEFSVAAPVIIDLDLSTTNLVFSFTSQPGLIYEIQRRANLASATWTVAVNGLAGSGGVLQATDTNPPTQRQSFYRVRGSL